MAMNLDKSTMDSYKQLLEINRRVKRSRIKSKIYLCIMVFMIVAGLIVNMAGFMLLEPSVINFLFITVLQLIAFISAFSYYELYLLEKGGKQS
jgi:hypothetical protein